MFKENIDLNLNFFQLKSPPLVGVDISASSVKMVELSIADKGNNTYRIERYAIEPLSVGAMKDGGIDNLEAVSESIERGWKRMNTKVKHVALALPAAEVITKKIIVPAGQREEDLAFQVENEASQYIPFAMDEVNMDFQELESLPENAEEIEVLIAASRKDKVEDRVAAALSAGLKAVVMDVEPYASQAAFELIEKHLPDGSKDKIFALIDIGATTMNLNVFHNGESVYMRDQPFGGDQLTQEIQNQYNLSPEEAEAAKRSGDLPENYNTDVLQPFCETLSIEVMRAVQFFFTSTQFTEINNIFIAGGCAVIPGLNEIVAARTQISTLTVNPFSSMELSSRIIPRQLNMDAPSLLIACGLAMRGFDST
jgi:type IV pilus assembly protein PilM